MVEAGRNLWRELVQHLCSKQDSWNKLFRAVSRQALDISKDGDNTKSFNKGTFI